MPNSLSNPYVGPRTFRESESNLFFGRDREARELLSLVLSDPLVLFYAQSGAGKSSLLNTRLLPNLREEGFETLPIGRVSGSLPEGITNVNNIFVFNLILSLDKNQHDPGNFIQMTLAEYLRQRPIRPPKVKQVDESSDEDEDDYDEDDLIPTRALIIDQFEEIITNNLEHWSKRQDFFKQLGRAIRSDPHLWVVLALREDYVARLDPYARYVPDRFRARFYMRRLEYKGALQAIEEPAKLGGRPFAAGVANTLADNLRQIRLQEQGDKTHLGEFIEPVQLQVVCYQLWENLRERPAAEITQQDLAEMGDVDTALAQFYEQTVAETIQETSVSEIDLRNWFSHQLITEAGTRGIVYQGAEQTGGLGNLAVNFLASKFLIRAEVRGGGTWYELVHDRFIDPILQSNQTWLLKHPLLQAANAWDEGGRRESDLYEGQQLKNALASDWQELGPLVEDFLNTSQALHENKEAEQEAEKEAQRQRELEAARELAAEAEARRQAEAKHAAEAEARAREQAEAAGQLRRRAMLLGAIGLAAVVLAAIAALLGTQARNNQADAEAHAQDAATQAAEANMQRETAILAVAEANTANTAVFEEKVKAEDSAVQAMSSEMHANEQSATAVAALATAESGLQEARDSLQAQAALVRDQLEAQNERATLVAQQAALETQLTAEAATLIAATTVVTDDNAIPTPTATAPATPTPDIGATQTVIALATQLAEVEAKQTAVARQPDLSGRLAIPMRLNGNPKVYITDIEGNGLNTDPVSLDGQQPAFSEDGTRLAINGAGSGFRGVYITDNSGNLIQNIDNRDSAWWPVFSPDGSTIAFVELEVQLLNFNLTSNRLTEFQINNFRLGVNNLLWTENNSLIFQGCAYWAGQSGECGTWQASVTGFQENGNLQLLDAGRVSRILSTSDARPTDAKNGQLLYAQKTGDNWDIYLVSVSGGTPQNLSTSTSQEGLAAFSPDGRAVAYVSNEGGSWALWTLNLDTNQKERRFEISSQRGTFNLDDFFNERISWGG